MIAEQWLSLSLIFLGAVLLLRLFEPLTRRCRERLSELKQPQEDPEGTPETLALEPPIEETSGFYFKRLVNEWGLLSLFFAIVALAFFPTNAQMLAEAFETLFDRKGVVIGTLPLGGVTVEVTDFLIYGLSTALAKLILGAVVAETRGTRLCWATLGLGIIPLLLLEIGISVNQGYQLAVAEESPVDPLLHGAFRGAQAAIYAFIEILGGYFTLHQFLFPLLRAALWLAIAPLRAIRRWIRDWFGRWLAQIAHAQPLRRAAACLDEGLFDPLRALDQALVQGIRKAFRPSSRGISHA